MISNNDNQRRKGDAMTELNSLVWSLRPDLRIVVQLPNDLTLADVERLRKLLDAELEMIDSNKPSVEFKGGN